MKPKVLFVSINFFSPEYLDGANKITYNLLSAKDFYSASFLSLYSGNLTLQEKQKFAHIKTEALLSHSSKFTKLKRGLAWLTGRSLAMLGKRESILLTQAIELKANSFDIIHLTSLELGACLKLLSPKTLRKVSLAAIDSYTLFTHRRIINESSFIKKLLLKRELRLGKKFERASYQLSPKTIFVSPIDEEYSRRNFPQGSYTNIPLGVDTEYFHPAPSKIKIKNEQIIFTGNLNYAPNRDACIFLVNEILPLIKREIPEIVLVLAGANPPPEIIKLNDSSVITTGKVPDLRPYIWESALYVCPIRFGAGMKNKTLEVLSMAKKCILSDVSLEGITSLADFPSINGKASAELWAKEIIKAINEEENTYQQYLKYREVISKNYSWEERRRSFTETLLRPTPLESIIK